MLSKKPICSFYGIIPEMENYLRSKLKGYSIHISNQELTKENLNPKTEILGVFVESPVTKEIITKLPHVKLIVTLSTGYDHIDLKAAKKRHVPVCNVPTYGENTVAEHALALTLALSRKLFQSVKRVKEGLYDFHGLRGFDLMGKTVGVVGTGHIGMHFIKIVKGLGCNVIAYDPFPSQDKAKEIGFTYVNFNKLLGQSDIISLHVPLLKQTRHLINKKNIKKIKPGAYLINTARGGLVEPEALVLALESGQIAGAGLDVLEDENLIQNPEKLFTCKYKECTMKASLMNNIIIDHPNTIVTPHNAFNSTEALHRILDTTVANIKGFSKGDLQNVIKVR